MAAKHYVKRVKNGTILDSSREYIEELAQKLENVPFDSKGQISTRLVRPENGRYGETWMHPELVVEFPQPASK